MSGIHWELSTTTQETSYSTYSSKYEDLTLHVKVTPKATDDTKTEESKPLIDLIRPTLSSIDSRPPPISTSSYLHYVGNSSYGSTAYTKLKAIEISGLTSLSPEQQSVALQEFAKSFFTLIGESHYRSKLSEIYFNEERNHSYSFSLSRSGSKKTQEDLEAQGTARSGARQSLLEAYGKSSARDSQPFRCVISQWLEETQDSGKPEKSFFVNVEKQESREPNRQLVYIPSKINTMDSFYRHLMGSELLEELITYFKTLQSASLSQEELPFEEFVYDARRIPLSTEDNLHFANHLKLLANAPYFPLRLKLPSHTYSAEEFEDLVILIRTSETKGISHIDLGGSKFTRDQLNQLLCLVEEHNKEKWGICQLKHLETAAESQAKDQSQQERSQHFTTLHALPMQIEAACKANARIIDRQRILSLLNAGTVNTRFPLRSREEPAEPGMKQPHEESGSAESKQDARQEPQGEEAPKPPAKRKRLTASAAADKRPLSDLLERIMGQNAQVHLQQELGQEQAQEFEQAQEVAQHQEVNQNLEALDAKDVVDYTTWLKTYTTYLFNDFSLRFLKEDPANWFSWTLDGVDSPLSVNSFKENALKKISQYPTLFRDGLSFDHPPQGFTPQQAMVAGKKQRVLLYGPPQPGPVDPFAMKLTQPAARSHNTNGWVLKDLVDGNKQQKEEDTYLLHRLMSDDYCSETSGPNHGFCNCLGCKQTLLPADQRSLEEKVATVFLKDSSQPALEAIRSFFGKDGKGIEVIREELRHLDETLNGYPNGYGPRVGGIAYSEYELKKIGEKCLYRLDKHTARLEKPLDNRDKERSPLYQETLKIRWKHLAQLINARTGLELPETDEAKAWYGEQYAGSLKGQTWNGQEPSLMKAKKTFSSTSAGNLTDNQRIAESLLKDWGKAVTHYEQDLANQRAAFYRLLWGRQRSAPDIHREFPILQRCSLHHLRLLLEIAAKYDLGPGYETDRKPEILEALLKKFQQIRELDGNSQTFDLLFDYVLKPSDNWMTTLFTRDQQLAALDSLCRLSLRQRANWNYLLERHGKSCGYVDLHHAWALFQHLLSEDKRRPENLRLTSLDFRQFSEDSVQNLFLFSEFLSSMADRARDREEQLELFASQKIRIHQLGAYYAMRYQGYFLVSERMQLEVSPEQKAAAQSRLKAVFNKAKELETITIDYKIDRSRLLADRKSLHFYRYLGQQSHAALKMRFYEQCVDERLGESKGDTSLTPDLVLLAITSAHERAANLQEGQASAQLWQLLQAKKENPATQAAVEALLSWHKAENFAPLTFVEAATLIHLWAAAPLEEQAALIAKTKAIFDNPLAREPFSRTLREIYAPSLVSPSPILPLSDYLKGNQALNNDALFGWLNNQWKLLKNIDFLSLQTQRKLSPMIQQSIKRLVAELPTVRGKQEETLSNILRHLWDPANSLSNVPPEDLAEKNAQIEEQAKRFLDTLLDKKAIWRKRRNELLHLLNATPHLEAYDFALLTPLLQAANSLPFVDSELKLLKSLLSAQGQLANNLRPAFCEGMATLCRLQTLSPSQRERCFSLLHFYAAQRYAAELPIATLIT